MYPTIKGELLRLLNQLEVGSDVYHAAAVEGGGGDNGAREGEDQAAAGTAAAAPAVEAEERAREEEGSLFWMAFDDFTSEFSQARKRVSCPVWYKSTVMVSSFHYYVERCV